MIKRLICCIILLILGDIVFISTTSNAYDDIITHPAITERAMHTANSKLDQYLKNNLGFNAGLATRFNSNNLRNTVRDWLKKGSTDEDSPNCRASHHFHNPLKSWSESYMTDEPWLITFWCYKEGYAPKYSNITWATGYKERGGKVIERTGAYGVNKQEMG